MTRERTVKVTILGDADQLKKAFAGAAEHSSKLGSALGGVAKIASGFVLAQGLLKAPAVLGALSSTARDLELQMKKANTVFGDQLGIVQEWAEKNASSMGLSTRATVNLAAGLADLLIPMGMTRDAAAAMATKTVGLSGALAEWSGGQKSAAEVSAILTKAYLGETDGLKALGIAISADQVKAQLAKEGKDKLTGAALEQAKALAIQTLVFEKSTDAQAAFASGAGSAARSQAEFSAKIAELKENIAVGLQPVFLAFADFLTTRAIPILDTLAARFREDVLPVIQRFGAFIQESVVPALQHALPMLEQFAGEVLSAIADSFRNDVQPVLEAFVKVLRDPLLPALASVAGFVKDELLPQFVQLGKWLADHKEVVVAAVAAYVSFQVAVMAIAAVQFATVVIGVTTAFIAMTQAVGFATAAQTLLNIAMTANPIGLVVVAIAALVAGAILVWQNWDHITETLGRFADVVHDKVGGAFSALGSGVKSTVNWIIDSINRLISAWNGLQFSVALPFGNEINIGTPDIPHIPRLDRGGIITRPGLVFADRGEQFGGVGAAVAPLPRGGTTLVLQVNSEGEANAVLRAVQALERVGAIQRISIVGA